jgi:hypothetical protein
MTAVSNIKQTKKITIPLMCRLVRLVDSQRQLDCHDLEPSEAERERHGILSALICLELVQFVL